MTCKDCLKKELGYCKFGCAEPQRCDDFKHKSEWIHLPCNINDTFYYSVAPVVHGECIGKPIAGYSSVRCSNCRTVYSDNNGRWNYCPNCGAIMNSYKQENKR